MILDLLLRPHVDDLGSSKVLQLIEPKQLLLPLLVLELVELLLSHTTSYYEQGYTG
jgi:hypothetical protein